MPSTLNRKWNNDEAVASPAVACSGRMRSAVQRVMAAMCIERHQMSSPAACELMRRLHGICMAGLMTDFASCRESATLPRAKPAMPTDQIRGMCNTNVIRYECLQCMLVADATQLHQLLPKTQVCYGMEPQNGPCCIDSTLDVSHCSALACLCLTLGRRGGVSVPALVQNSAYRQDQQCTLFTALFSRQIACWRITPSKLQNPGAYPNAEKALAYLNRGGNEVMVIRMLGVAGRASLRPYNDQQQH